MNRRLILICSWCCLVSLIVVATANSAERVTAQQRKQITALAREYAQARNDFEKKAEVIKRAADLGAPAAERLQEAVMRELAPQLEKYAKAYTTVATRLSVSRASNINPAEVNALREQYRQLWNQADLTKQMIEQHGDPLLDRLETLLVIKRDDVLAAHAGLQPQRDALMQLGQFWEACSGVLYDEFVKTVTDPEVRQSLRRPSMSEYIDAEEKLAARLAMPMEAKYKAILAANARVATRLPREEGRAILATNLMRVLLGKSPCQIDVRLCSAARDHSSDMKSHQFFSHESPVPGKKSFTDRAKNFGAKGSAENIAIHGSGGSAVVKAWYYSPGHHLNLFRDHQTIGVGQAGRYWTQMFGRK